MKKWAKITCFPKLYNFCIFDGNMIILLFKLKKLVKKKFLSLSLCEKRPNMKLFLVRIFLYLDWIQENTDQK